MARAATWAILLIAAAASGAMLFFLRDTLTQFALAFILWIGIEGVAAWVYKRSPLPRWASLAISLLGVLSITGLIAYGVSRNIGQFVLQTDAYQARLDALAAQVFRVFHIAGPPPTMSSLLAGVNGGEILAGIAAGLQSLASNVVFILIYLGFLFAAARQFSPKLDLIFTNPQARIHAADVLTAIRVSMQRYLWVQTVISAIITGLTYLTLLALGLDNALFWSFLIFFLNYIPTIGSIVATVLPTLFALIQFDSLLPVGLVAAGVGGWQFVIGNIVQPRMMGESLNLSALVVLLSLAIWGALWGIAGAFLAAPLTVMIMIVMAQFPETRWLAILLSADGNPTIKQAAPPPAPLHSDEPAEPEPEPPEPAPPQTAA